MSVKKRDLLRLTLLSLRSNLLRSGLTMVGVFMGVAAVMGMLQVRTISQQIIAKQLAEREAPQAMLYSWEVDFQPEDLDYLRSRMRNELTDLQATLGTTLKHWGVSVEAMGISENQENAGQ